MGESEVECAGGGGANGVFVVQAQVRYGDVNVVDDCFENFHEITALLFFFVFGGPFGSGWRERAEERTTADNWTTCEVMKSGGGTAAAAAANDDASHLQKE